MKGRRVSLLAGFVLAGCNPDPTDGTEPTLVELSAPGVCSGTPSAFPDPELESLFESRLESYCLDPNAPPRTYEHAAGTGVDDLCSELTEEQCRSLKQFGLRRLTILRYIRDDGSPAAVNVVLSRLATTEGALAYYSSRVLAERDPKQLDLRQLPGQRYSALNRAMATVFRGPFVVEAHYSNARQAPAELHAESAHVLPRILARLGQDSVRQRLPASVRRLPKAERLEHGLSFEATAAFGIVGLGQAATGYYERSGKRYRVTVSEAEDPGLARDVYHALRRLPGRRLLKNMPFDAFEIREVTDSGAVAEWLVGKLGGVVVAVMDEPFVLGPGTPAQRHTRCLDRNEKLSVLRSTLRGS